MWDQMLSNYSGYNPYLRWDYNFEHRQDQEKRICVVGIPQVGKRTLCNHLWGVELLENDPSNNGEIGKNYGVFSLVNLPQTHDDLELIMPYLLGAELVIFLLDAERGVSKQELAWIARLRATSFTLLIALNKVDCFPKKDVETQLEILSKNTARKVIPLVARSQDYVQKHFVPILIKACPELEITLAAEVTALRPKVARKLIWESVMRNGLNETHDSPNYIPAQLADIQLRLVNQIASIYGFKAQQDLFFQWLMNTLLGYIQKYAEEQWTKHNPEATNPWSGALGAFSTWLVGRFAVAYFESNMSLPSLWQQDVWKEKHEAPSEKPSQ